MILQTRTLPDCPRCGAEPRLIRVRGNMIRFLFGPHQKSKCQRAGGTPSGCETGPCDSQADAEITWIQLQRRK